MLRNKKAVYLLIPLNVLIWGYFVYRFYTAYTGDGDPVIPASTKTMHVAELKDSVIYTLALDYKDPFLKAGNTEPFYAEVQRPVMPAVKREAPVARVTPSITPKQLPDIKYLGLIRNTTSGVSTALITLNGRSLLIRQNETLEGIVFKSFNHDSLVAKWGRERIVARK